MLVGLGVVVEVRWLERVCGCVWVGIGAFAWWLRWHTGVVVKSCAYAAVYRSGPVGSCRTAGGL